MATPHTEIASPQVRWITTIMGIVITTPDSFSDGGLWTQIKTQ